MGPDTYVPVGEGDPLLERSPLLVLLPFVKGDILRIVGRGIYWTVAIWRGIYCTVYMAADTGLMKNLSNFFKFLQIFKDFSRFQVNFAIKTR